MRQKESKFASESKVAKEVTRILNSSSLTQHEVCSAMNLKNSNVLTMFKQGRTKLPITQVVPLCKAVGVDPGPLMELVLDEYLPEAKEALFAAFGVSKAERLYIDAIRKAQEYRTEQYRERRGTYSSPGNRAPKGKCDYLTGDKQIKALYEFALQHLIDG